MGKGAINQKGAWFFTINWVDELFKKRISIHLLLYITGILPISPWKKKVGWAESKKLLSDLGDYTEIVVKKLGGQSKELDYSQWAPGLFFVLRLFIKSIPRPGVF
jgi:hypothetical protein